MCDAFLSEYASSLNDDFSRDGTNTGLIPTAVFFDEPDCGGTMFPSNQGNVSNYDYSKPLTLSLVPQSFFIPFNIPEMTLYSKSGLSTTVNGPFVARDTSLLSWSSKPTAQTMNMDPIVSVSAQVLDYENEVVVPACMGKQQLLGSNVLTYLEPQKNYCNNYMKEAFCAKNPQHEYCSCFAELPVVQKLSQSLDPPVNLPVICFGPQCATKNSYKTQGMLQDPCNLILCRTTINETPGIFNNETDQVFCGGQYYNSTTPVVIPSASTIPPPTDVADGNEQSEPFYIWIMIAVSALLFILLIYLFFTSPSPHKSSVGRQITKLKRDLANYQKKSVVTKGVDLSSMDNVVF